MGTPLLDINALMEYLNIKKATIYDMVYRKRIPYIKVGNQLRFNREHIDRWLMRNTHYPVDMPICYNNIEVEGREREI